MDFSSIIGAVAPMLGGILGGGKKEEPQQVAQAPQQASVFTQPQAPSNSSNQLIALAEKLGEANQRIAQLEQKMGLNTQA
ncbi:MAG: hypothetical protein A2039_06915 [Candidatus Melainabacteria bacterium GWA2_34_9]|nr:MAG: hypothetical protein A2039_06915 [Candidatus Melainabacteria bacterium GWA2_34_9]